MTAVLDRPPLPGPPPGGEGDGEINHIWCCRPEVTLCGADLSGHGDHDDDCAHPVCPLCTLADKDGLPCPVPGCPEGGTGG